MRNNKVSRLLAAFAAAAIVSGLNLAPAFAESESGGFVFGDGSETGGVTPMGAYNESGGIAGLGNRNESGGAYGTGAESESGGVTQTGASSESDLYSRDPSNESGFNAYVKYYGDY